ncbi:MAG: terminase small subunit [Gallionella sp.]
MPVLKNSKHEYFAHQVANGTKPVDAYIAAGYSKNGADQSSSKLLKKTEIAARVAEIAETIANRAIDKSAIDKAWVMKELVEVVKMAKAYEPVISKDGTSSGEVKQNLAAANAALNLIGKELSMFVDRKEIRTGTIDDMTPDALDKFIERKAKEAGVKLH